MNEKYFKYENKNKRKIRLKDLLMLFSVLTLCIVTAIVSGRVSDDKTAANTNIPKEDISISSDIAGEITADSDSSTNVSREVSYEPPLAELSFQKPLDGTVIKPFSPDSLVYSETMDDWRIHRGVDIACPVGTKILSAERGTVTSVEYDINYGNTVVIETEDYTARYSSLSAEIPLKVGDVVNRGDTVGVSDETCMIEICDEPHIHFELLKDGIHVDPMEYIHFN